MPTPSPARGYLVVAAGVAVNLCLGILYAWSVWKAALVAGPPGDPMPPPNAGWEFLSDAQATVAYAVCGVTFALAMIPGGRVQDRFGPRVGATAGGLCLAAGCVLAGLAQSFVGLVVGFGLLGGVGMGLGYAAATPAAVRWFGPHRRGLVAGVVVGGYGAAAVYIAPLARALIDAGGIAHSFTVLGVGFAGVVVVAGRLLTPPPAGYVPPGPPSPAAGRESMPPRDMVRTAGYWRLLFLMFASAQGGLLVIANAAGLLRQTATPGGWLANNGWALAAFGGVVNALGRVGTGFYSDRVGRPAAYALNGTLAAAALVATPFADTPGLLFLLVGVAFWQYGGGLALLPAMTADRFGPRHLGANYGLVFLGWGAAFLVPLLAGVLKDRTGSLSLAFWLSAGALAAGVVAGRGSVRA
jgi:OFA family oxalate/formate antiporter-like MFS transporter